MTRKKMAITSLGEFIEWVSQLPSLDYGKYLFRGVPNTEYGIQASAYRRPKEDARSPDKFLQINKQLLTEARLRGHGEKDGRKLGDLEILAELQHYGAATCLIDFTYNAQIALYFACQKDFKWERNSKDSQGPPDGKVYVVSNDPNQFEKIVPDSLEKQIDEFLQGSQLYHWEPGHQNNRVIAQQSIFLFGLHEFDEFDECVIEENSKQHILSELEQISGITQAVLFPDFDGFARSYSEDVLYTEPSTLDYEFYALDAYLSEQYEEAIKNYDLAINLSPQDASLYSSRGRVRNEMKLYEEAILDFNKAIEMDPGQWHAFYDRGIAHYNLQRYKESIIDLNKVIEKNPDHTEAYTLRARAKHKMEQYNEAITDYSEVISRTPRDRSCYYYRALAKQKMGDEISAEEDINMARLLAEGAEDIKLLEKIDQDFYDIPF